MAGTTESEVRRTPALGLHSLRVTLPDDQRKTPVHSWVSELVVNGAPQGFVRAIACLLDDRVAEKAYEVIFQCSRKPVLPRIFKRN